MAINKFSVAGMLSGIFFMISAWVRYFIIYPDLDKALVYGIVGGLIFAVFFLYYKLLRNTDEIQEEVDKINVTLLEVEEYIANKSRSGTTYGE